MSATIVRTLLRSAGRSATRRCSAAAWAGKLATLRFHGTEERVLLRDHVAALAGLEVQDERLQRVGRGDDLLRLACLPTRVAQVGDGEQHRAEDDRHEDREHAARDQQALAERVTQAKAVSAVRPGGSGSRTWLVPSARIDAGT